ncbi:MAG TPA: sulfite exporter TauE/SafE family protein [Chloroflexota bacterium]|nr:sulfite exporter TauE/SafE family protein [Chloroflexota bacterium]
MTINPVFLLLGAFVGLLVGLTGMGGASLMTPLLVLVAGVRPVVAVGTDIAYSLIAKLVGGAVHARQRTVDWGVTLRLAAGSGPGALLGVLVLSRYKTQLSEAELDKQVLHWVGMMLIVVALVMAARIVMPLLAKNAAWLTPKTSSPVWLPALGAVTGFLVGLTSVGSGTLVVPVLSLFTLLPAATLVGTDIAHAVLLLAIASFGHVALGTVNFVMAANLALGSIPGVIVGSRLCARVPEPPLRLAIASVLLISAAKLL